MIELRDLCKTYVLKGRQVKALENINLTIEDGEIIGIVGLSGAGKSTLVRCLNYLERPTSGEVLIDGQNLNDLTDKELRLLRRSLGMIFQDFNLLEQRTALQNICYPLEIAGWTRAAALERAEQLLDVVKLKERAQAFPSQLSGGQKQRVAIARALALSPKVLLCDEATSALDPETTASILELLQRINREMGVTIVVITHEMKVVEKICHRMVVLDKAHVVEMGNAQRIFVNPQSDMAKRLLAPQETTIQTNGPGKVFRIAFDGNSASEPVVAGLARDYNICVSVLHAEQQIVDGKVFGQMVIQAPDDDLAYRRICAYLQNHHVTYREDES